MNKNDTEAIVKEFLELWQKQFAQMSMEGEPVSQGLANLQKMQDAYINALGDSLGNTGNAKSTTITDILRNINKELTRLADSHVKLEGRITKIESLLTSRGARITKKTKPGKSSRIRKGTPKTDI